MILRYLRGRDWMMVAMCVFFIACQVYLDLRIPEYMSEITDALQMGASTDVVADCGTRMLGCALLSLVAALCTAGLSSRVASSLCWTLRSMLFERVGGFSKQDIDGFSAASLITRSTNDVYQLQQFVGRAIHVIVKAPLLGVFAVYKINSSSFEWTAITVACMAVMVAAFSLMLWRAMPHMRRMQWYVDAVNRITREGLEGTKGIRAYNAESRHERRFSEASGNLLDNSVDLVRIMAPMHPLSSSMMNFLTLAIYWVGAGIIQSASGQTEQMYLFSDMIVFTSYATLVVSSVMMASGILRGLPRIMVSARRIEEVISHESSVGDGDMPAGTAPRDGTVSLEDVTFSYPGTDKRVLEGISFEVPKGGTLAVIGPTASGKSTLLSLIVRLYDVTSGSVRVDGHDVREYGLEDLHSRIGYVPQTPVVFSGTIRENVGYGDGPSDDASVERALRIAQMWRFISTLPDGIDTDLSQHGWNLSGGQRQRLGIARALCRDPEIMLFDDTFSALDYRTDRDLRDALARETSGITKIIVAQRVGTIMDADRIIVLDGGRIVGSGTHEELMRACPLYREIAESQLEGGADGS